MVFPGWEVARLIPPEAIQGLLTGQYKLYGGVIRWAAGTPQAGQIVTHLLPAGSQFLNFVPGLNFIPGLLTTIQLAEMKEIVKNNTLQLGQISTQLGQLSTQVGALSQTTQQVLQVATGTAVLSGLGLAVSCVGFVVINKKLNTIDTKLKEIQKDVQAIQQFLDSSERARLFAALDCLVKLDKTPIDHRHTILHNARQTLIEINMRYRELLPTATSIATAVAYEEYFALTALAQIRATAELGMLDVAYDEAQDLNRIWQTQARRIAKEIFLSDYPERFLASDFVDVVTTFELMQWLDFAHDEAKGFQWLDDLRRKIDEPWYSKGWLPINNGGSGLNKNIGVGMEKEQTLFIPAMRKLIARSQVFEGYVSQYELFSTQELVPSKFEQAIAALPESSAIDGYVILQPMKIEEKVTSKRLFQMTGKSK
jgi:hypothetical protein